MAPRIGSQGVGQWRRYAEDRWSDPRGDTTPIAWAGQAGSSGFDYWFDSRCHDVSVIAVWHLGVGSKTAVLTIRPW